MAARRLIVVLVLLLAASIVAASVAPERTGRLVGVTDTTSTTETTTTEQTTTETTTTAPAPATPAGGGGEELSVRINASVKHPETVRGLVGNQLALAVGADPPRSIAIPSLGLTEFAAEDAPAHFNLLLRTAGTYAITDGDDPSVILGRIEVRKPGADGAAEDRDGSKEPRRPESAG